MMAVSGGRDTRPASKVDQWAEALPQQSHCSAQLQPGGHRNLGLQGQAPGRPRGPLT